MIITRKSLIIPSLILFVLSHLFFLINIQFPKGHNFDEFHYVPSAKQFLELRENQNIEHPPLGKILIACGMALWGDQPLGWRYMSTLFGALTLVGMYLFAWVLFKNQEIAVWVALLSVASQLLYVQARIGMLDTFMFAFLIWSMAAFCATWDTGWTKKQLRMLLFFAGTMIGLSIACKWFSIAVWLSLWGLVIGIKILQHFQIQFHAPKPEDWYRTNLWKELDWMDWVFFWLIVPVISYSITFLPFFLIDPDYSIINLYEMQLKMWDAQGRVVASHPYMSFWYEWPLLTRPIWYAFDREGSQQEWVRGVLLLGNPLVMWGGLVAITGCIWNWIQTRNRISFLILFFYGVFFFSWVFIPRKLFFYYYYYPAGMILSAAIAAIFYTEKKSEQKKFQIARWIFLMAAFVLFIYFFPILSALKIPFESFREWMWFMRWI